MSAIENQKKWIEALRSGEYEQGKGRLHIITNEGEHKFCCLGVACEVYQKETGNRIEQDELTEPVVPSVLEEAETVQVITYGTSTAFLPLVVQEWLGVSSCVPEVCGGDDITKYNDAGGFSFEEIADLIEGELIFASQFAILGVWRKRKGAAQWLR